jgi:hypothetical protein
MSIAKILEAMRADAIPESMSGLWSIQRLPCFDVPGIADPVLCTHLFRVTEATLHLPHGECVMVDHRQELRSHLNFIIQASGRVLVSGLGLGCVVRGLLAKQTITRIDVIERDPAVLTMVAPWMPTDKRLRIHEGDATCYSYDLDWHYAWHDLWSDESAGDPHLQVQHMRAIVHFYDQVKWQGAWRLPRWTLRKTRIIS